MLRRDLAQLFESNGDNSKLRLEGALVIAFTNLQLARQNELLEVLLYIHR